MLQIQNIIYRSQKSLANKIHRQFKLLEIRTWIYQIDKSQVTHGYVGLSTVLQTDAPTEHQNSSVQTVNKYSSNWERELRLKNTGGINFTLHLDGLSLFQSFSVIFHYFFVSFIMLIQVILCIFWCKNVTVPHIYYILNFINIFLQVGNIELSFSCRLLVIGNIQV